LVGSEDEFDRLVRVASPALLRAAWLLVGDWPAAEDLVQGAFADLAEVVEAGR
jgi:DNA-directed RNA polymerase specialized sigma24 family protein